VISRFKPAALALALAAFAGCGGGEDAAPAPSPAATPEFADPSGGGPPRSGTARVEAEPDGSPAFVQDAISARAGRVRLELVNPSQTEHSLCVESAEQGPLGCTGTFRANRSTLRLQLGPGRYTFICSVPGHREAGMEGDLTIE
jgi:plastocyanin